MGEFGTTLGNLVSRFNDLNISTREIKDEQVAINQRITSMDRNLTSLDHRVPNIERHLPVVYGRRFRCGRHDHGGSSSVTPPPS